MERRPGTPSLLRELNDRAALDLLLPGTPLTRTQISEQTRVSTPSAVTAAPVLRGAILAAVDQARTDLLGAV